LNDARLTNLPDNGRRPATVGIPIAGPLIGC
jgi:hypothetical protein